MRRNSRHSCCGVNDFGYQVAGFVVGVSAADASGDDQRFCGPAVGVDVFGGQLVEHHVDIGARHMVDLRVRVTSAASSALASALSVDAAVVQV